MLSSSASNEQKIKLDRETMEISSMMTLSLNSIPPTRASSAAFLTSHNSSFINNGSSSSSSSRSLFFKTTKKMTNSLVLKRTQKGCQCLFGLGIPELAVIAGVVALVFGPKKLPEVGRSIGKTVKSFQQAAKEFESELKKEPETASEPLPEEPKAVSDEKKQDTNISSTSTETKSL